MAKEFVMIFSIEQLTVGDSFKSGASLPLHCTVMPWVTVPFRRITQEQFRKRLASIAYGTDPQIELVSKERKLFGPYADIPVHVLHTCEALNLLHTELLVFLASLGSSWATRLWIGAGYRPHVSNTEGRIFPPGSRFTPTSLFLVKRGACGMKRVVDEFSIGCLY